jgi:hypothetical protein
MAATSQAHDEARHFYVLRDYLRALGEAGAAPRRHRAAPAVDPRDAVPGAQAHQHACF